jgi:DNA-binding CsgD family transcriptional regulator
VRGDITVEKIESAQNHAEPPELWLKEFDEALELISIHDAEFRIVRANASFARMVGRERHSLIGQKCYEVVHGLTEPFPGCPHLRSVEVGRAMVEEIFEPRLNVHLVVSVSPVFIHSCFVGSIHVAREVTPTQAGPDRAARPPGSGDDVARAKGRSRLTKRQKEVFDLLSEGKVVKEIAVLLGISTRTVEFHKHRMMKNLGARTVAALIKHVLAREASGKEED